MSNVTKMNIHFSAAAFAIAPALPAAAALDVLVAAEPIDSAAAAAVEPIGSTAVVVAVVAVATLVRATAANFQFFQAA